MIAIEQLKNYSVRVIGPTLELQKIRNRLLENAAVGLEEGVYHLIVHHPEEDLGVDMAWDTAESLTIKLLNRNEESYKRLLSYINLE